MVDHYNLPEEFHFSHDFCFFLHDQLVSTLKSGEKAGIFNYRWKFREGDKAPPEGVVGEELITWLEKNGHKDVVFILYYKQICAALLADMLHFIYEALTCSAKGKLTVAYALLRKPMKENLLYLEWLLADPASMLAAFDGEDIYAKSINRVFPEFKKVRVITEAIKRTEYVVWIDADFIYDLRYNKNFPAGLERLFQQANHLITSFRFMETERSNFNFVFSDEDCWSSQWEGLYSFLPFLLFHSVQIVEALISNFANRKEGVDLTDVRTAIGMIFWLERSPHAANSSSLRDDIRKSLGDIGLSCPECGKAIEFEDEQLLKLYWENALMCRACNWEIDISSMAGDL